jgi:hypothetical protein
MASSYSTQLIQGFKAYIYDRLIIIYILSLDFWTLAHIVAHAQHFNFKDLKMKLEVGSGQSVLLLQPSTQIYCLPMEEASLHKNLCLDISLIVLIT